VDNCCGNDHTLVVGNGEQLYDARVNSHPARHRHYRDSCAYYQWPEAALTPAHTWNGVFHMNKGISVALLVVGIVLIIWGVSASESFSSDVSRFFTGSPTNKTVWLLIGGMVTAIVGLFGLLRGVVSSGRRLGKTLCNEFGERFNP